ncbi:hypothetical protein TNCV_4246151 [Trichonephila clavipes]|nr:hypothetical protein TNCV_4246151 [Trichonephila clavipes]
MGVIVVCTTAKLSLTQKTRHHLMDPCYFHVVLVLIPFIVDRVRFFLHGSHNLVIIQHLKSNLLHRMPSRFLHLLHRILEILGSTGMHLNPGGDMDVRKCIVLVRHRGTLNSNPLVNSVKGEERWKFPDHIQSVPPQNWDGTEPNRPVTHMVLKAAANDRRTYSPLPR